MLHSNSYSEDSSTLKKGAKKIVLRILAGPGNSAPFVIKKGIFSALNIKLRKKDDSIKYPNGTKSFACISVDFDVTAEWRFYLNRKGTERLLELSELHGIPLTWAMCGRDALRDSESYKKITSSPICHEIAVHTYSHLDALRTSREDFIEDVKKCIEALKLERAKTFVYPWNRVNYLDSVSGLGFIAYRSKEREIGQPVRDGSIWRLSPVLYIDSKSLGCLSIARNLIEVCHKNNGLFHLWLHPWNVGGEDGERIISTILDPVFRLFNEKKKDGMTVATCGQIAELMGGAI